MISGFLLNGIIGGLIIALISGILGSFVLWKRMSYFGDALSHSAFLGVALGLLWGINLPLSVAIVAIIFALIFSNNKVIYSSDTILGILSYSALSLSIVISSYSNIKIDLMSYLFGDILTININDIYALIISAIIIVMWVYINWQKLILLCISYELLQAEGVNARQLKLVFSLILALFVAVSFKIVGILLITAMLIIPAAGALNISHTPLQMIIFSIIIGFISVMIGLTGAVFFDVPTGPAIILLGSTSLIITNLVRLLRK